jgi:hypothetical protein
MIFLQGDEHILKEAKLQLVVAPGPDAERSLHDEHQQQNSVASVASSMWNALTTGVETVQSAFAAPKVWPKTHEDQICDNISSYAALLEVALTSVHGNVELLINKHRELSREWKDLTTPSHMLGTFEMKKNEVHLGQAFTDFGSACDKVSSIIRATSESENIHFREHIKDQIRLSIAVKELMLNRNSILEKYHAALSQVEQKSAKVESLKGKDLTKLQEAEKAMKEAEEFAVQMKAHVEAVTQKAIAETARWRKDKKRDSLNVVKDYVRLQISNAKKVQSTWESLLTRLETDQVPSVPTRASADDSIYTNFTNAFSNNGHGESQGQQSPFQSHQPDTSADDIDDSDVRLAL